MLGGSIRKYLSSVMSLSSILYSGIIQPVDDGRPIIGMFSISKCPAHIIEHLTQKYTLYTLYSETLECVGGSTGLKKGGLWLQRCLAEYKCSLAMSPSALGGRGTPVSRMCHKICGLRGESEEEARVGKGGWVAEETWPSSQPQLLIPPPPPKRKIRNGAKFNLLMF